MKLFWRQFWGNKKTSDRHYFEHGFTFVELLVSMGIVMIISTQILVSFSGLNEASTLNRAAQELAFNIRRAQNMSLAINGVTIGGIKQIPHAVGLRLSSQVGNNDRYFFFADQNNNGKYDGPVERIEPNIFLPDSIRITFITSEVSFNPGAHIIFYTPEATLALTDATGAPVTQVMDVVLTGPSGATRTVRIQISGQVTVS